MGSANQVPARGANDLPHPRDADGERDRAAATARANWGPTVATTVWCLVVMAVALPRRIQPGDAGEFATVMLRGGVPHPSGYPWMRVLGPLARTLEAMGLPPPTAAALPCAALAVVGMVLAQRVAARIAAPWVAAGCVCLIAASPGFVAHAYDSEVWGPLLAATGIFVHMCVRARSPRPLWLGLALGLAVTTHLTAILLLPLAVAAAWPEPAPADDRRQTIAVLRAGLEGVAGSALGLTFFATLSLGRGGAWRWGDVREPAGLLRHVVRGDYGVVALSLHTERPPVWTLWRRSFAAIADAVLVGLGDLTVTSPAARTVAASIAATGVLALVLWLLRSAAKASPRPPGWSPALARGWAVSLLLSAAAFPAAHNISPDSPFGAWILARFDLLTLVLLIAPMAAALTAVGHAVKARSTRLGVVLAVAGALLVGVQAVRGVGHRAALDGGVEAHAVDLLESATPGAIVFGTDDHRTFPALYAAEVLGAGGDTVYVDASLLAHPWYRERLAARRPDIPWQSQPIATMNAVWTTPGLERQPIYIANHFSRPSTTLPVVPEGLSLRVIPPTTTPPGPEAVLEAHLAALGRMRARPRDFAGRTHPAVFPFSADLWAVYVRRHRELAEGLRRAGRGDLAARLERAWAEKFEEAAKSTP